MNSDSWTLVILGVAGCVTVVALSTNYQYARLVVECSVLVVFGCLVHRLWRRGKF